MSLVRPDAVVVVDGRRLTAAEAAVSELHVELGLGGALDRATVTLSAWSPVLDAVFGAVLAISMGDGDGQVDVFTGTVVHVRAMPAGAVVEALTDAFALTGTRVGRAYVSQTAADIATDLIQAGGVTPGTVEAPLELAAYHVDERRTAWRHLQDLGRLSGSVLRSGADGSVDFQPVRAGAADHVLRGGAEMLTWHAGQLTSADAAPEVVPYGAGSEAGSSRWQFLLAEPDGGSPDAPTVVPAAIRTRDGARSVAEAWQAAVSRRSASGWVLATGVPAVRAGDLVDVTDLAAEDDRSWRVVGAHHRLDDGGLRSRLRLEAAA